VQYSCSHDLAPFLVLGFMTSPSQKAPDRGG
jgi:hypothetical protein